MAGPYPPGVALRAPAPIHHVWVVQPGDTARLARDIVSLRLIGRGNGGSVGLLAAGVVFLALSGTPGVVELATTSVALLIGFPLLMWRSTRRALEAVTAQGSVWVLGFGPSSMTVQSPVDTTTIDYAALCPPRQRGLAIKVPFRGNPTSGLLLPSPLCPPQALRYLTAQVRPGRSR